ncbi:hypothetical protein [Streptomyces purpureus]|uniref:Tat pathway signal sequence domain protein n=1 Tax=Streptomyces purpureus TaxID=1951 RepID=A0A918LM93_9ACTN|nr:hypothetical protein [Streptomyces purpureus]GGT18292.1 hypothetical protein GCM10014713_08940 [Streptomyces purpureus]
MRKQLRRHLGKVVAGTALAVTGTAVMVGVTLPGTAGADDTTGGRTAGAARGAAEGGGQGAGEGEDGSGPPPGPAVVAAAPAEGERGVGSDPLTETELKRARQLALPPAAADFSDVEGARGPQHLATNLADPVPGEPEATAPRRAEVRSYDYRHNTLITSIVNLDTGKVEKTGRQRGVQPSPHPVELREAIELILKSPLGKGLKDDYKDATGKDLTSPDQLWFNGDVYRTYREENVPPALTKCGEHRCVRLASKVLNGSWIDTRDLVVNLSTRTVTDVG